MCFGPEVVAHAVVDPDLQIGKQGGGGGLKTKMFWPFGPHFGRKKGVGVGHLGPSPGSTTVMICLCRHTIASNQVGLNSTIL